MVFEIKLLLSAQRDLEDAFAYYHKISYDLSQKFYSEFTELNTLLEKNPFLEIRYKNIRTYKLRSFPYVVHFVADEKKRRVIILAIVSGKRGKNNFSERIPDL